MKTPARSRSGRGRLAALAPADRLRLLAWLVILLPLAALGVGVQDRLHTMSVTVPGTESARAAALTKDAFGRSEQVLVLLQGPERGLRREAARVSRQITKVPHTSVLNPWTAGSRTLLPKPGQAILLVSVDDSFEVVADETSPRLRKLLRKTVDKPYSAHMTGYADVAGALHGETTIAVEHAELIAAIPLMLVLLLVLGTPIAAGVPLFLGGSIALSGWGLLDVINRITPLDVASLSLTTSIALALGIDYSLLMVARFRTELADGASVHDASLLAAARAGHTIRAAAIALAVTMVCLLVLIPSAGLKSAVVGVLVAVFMAFLGATLVLPPLLRLIGLDINRWQIVPMATQSGRWRAFGLIVLRRPVVAFVAVLALLTPLLIAALQFPTGPPDPSELPASSAARHDFEKIKETIGGTYAAPFVLTVAAREGTLADERLLELARFERTLARDRATLSVLGPATVARRTAELASVPSKLSKASAAVRRGRVAAGRLERGLSQASGGVNQLVDGLDQAARGSARLKRGGETARRATALIDDGLAAARAGAAQLSAGLELAEDGAQALAKGTGVARAGAGKLATNLERARRETAAARPGAAKLASGLKEGSQNLDLLKQPANRATDEARAALAALDDMLPTSKLDPAYARAYKATATAVAALTGRNPLTGERVQKGYDGLPAALDQGARKLAEAAAGARKLEDGVGRLETGLTALASGASRLAAGMQRIERGARALAGGETQLLDGARRLETGLGQLSAGTHKLLRGQGLLTDGSGQLSSALAGGSRRAQPLIDGVAQLATGAARFNRKSGKLARQVGDSKKLAPLFKSGYATLAALETAPAEQRAAASLALNLKRGGDAVQFLVVQKNDGSGAVGGLPTTADNPYRQRLQARAARLGRQLDAAALVGGPAATLSEFDDAVSSKLVVLIVALGLVAFVGLAILLRNILLPAIAVSLNFLSVGAAFGVLALCFGGDNPLLGGPGYVDDIMTAVIFTVAFALSIDYQIFLLVRMHEAYEATGNVRDAIVEGLENTAGVITGAGAIMVAVFLAFTITPLTTMRTLGLGLAVAVALDATLIRLVLLPAALKLAGDRAWRTPRWIAALSRPPRASTEPTSP